mgnify:FL=1
MREEKNVFVIDRLENIGKYAGLNANFAKAVAFLATGGFAALAPGKNALDGENAFVNNVETDYVLPAERKPEVHRLYFDIHVPLSDDEMMGLGAFDAHAKGSFDVANDIGFYAQDVAWHVIRKGEFCIVWPGTCAHAPAVTTTGAAKKARKLIVKVRA